MNMGIMTRVTGPVKRRYDASRRRQAAARTRAAILEAARQLFSERGYTATPMTAIADRAGVALDTVYATVGRKPELARLLIETAISGTDQATPAEQRDYVRSIRAAPDAETKIAMYAAAITAIAPRMALVMDIIHQAAPTEPELAALRTEIADRRAANMRLFVADLAAAASLRLDQGEAADIVWATNSAEMYQLLVGQRGWTPQRYERFLTDTWQRVLLAG
jgi:AcrR family transcriptional regulator